jgi:hypothetical protein
MNRETFENGKNVGRDRVDVNERAVEAAYRALLRETDGSDASSVEIPARTVERTKQAARHALNEAWFADQPHPQPSEKTLSVIREAVRGELSETKKAADDDSRSVRLSSPTAGSLAAAAMILCCIGVVQWAATQQPEESVVHLADSSRPAAVKEADETVDLFLAAADDAFDHSSFHSSMSQELESLQGSLSDWRNESTNDLEWADPLLEPTEEEGSEGGRQSHLDRMTPAIKREALG